MSVASCLRPQSGPRWDLLRDSFVPYPNITRNKTVAVDVISDCRASNLQGAVAVCTEYRRWTLERLYGFLIRQGGCTVLQTTHSLCAALYNVLVPFPSPLTPLSYLVCQFLSKGASEVPITLVCVLKTRPDNVKWSYATIPKGRPDCV